MNKDTKKAGIVGVVGKPNVGKSTLLNTLANKKVAIVSYKPQTTRNQIKYYFNNDKFAITFVDTPGFHFANNKLDSFLNAEIKKTFKICDLVLLLIDPTRPVDEEDLEVIKFIKSYKINNVVLVITKCDVVSNGSIKNHIEKISKYLSPVQHACISCKNNDLNELFSALENNLSNDGEIIQEEDNDSFMIAEIIREQVLLSCKKEVPYSTGILIDKTNFDEVSNTFNIYASVICEKESQKPILIGKNASMIKTIGTNARKELLKIYNCKINLKLFVKVEKDWRNNPKVLSLLGYSGK